MSRNLPWSNEEIILALDLYFRKDRGSITKTNPNIILLSSLLNKLRATPEVKDAEKFRNPSGVTLKLSNFLALDENYKGKGMGSYSKLDKELFDKYSKNLSLLKEDAATIRSAAAKK